MGQESRSKLDRGREQLEPAGNHRDGDWLRVSRWGIHVAELRTVKDRASLVDLAEL